jgi:hypothetical protein
MDLWDRIAFAVTDVFRIIRESHMGGLSARGVHRTLFERLAFEC